MSIQSSKFPLIVNVMRVYSTHIACVHTLALDSTAFSRIALFTHTAVVTYVSDTI